MCEKELDRTTAWVEPRGPAQSSERRHVAVDARMQEVSLSGIDQTCKRFSPRE